MTHTTHEAVADRHDRHSYERMIVLSDGIFAIAVTLLALELHPTGAKGDDWVDLLNALMPKLMAYAISFLVVAIFWTAQRRTFARLVRVDGVFVWMTLIYLGLVALIPAATDMMYSIAGSGPPTIYLGLIMLISAVQALGWGYAAFIGKLAAPEVKLSARLYLFLVALLGPGVFAGVSFYISAHEGSVGVGWWVLVAALAIALRYGSRHFLKGLRN
jgi:uncharacterized membrane protein